MPVPVNITATTCKSVGLRGVGVGDREDGSQASLASFQGVFITFPQVHMLKTTRSLAVNLHSSSQLL